MPPSTAAYFLLAGAFVLVWLAWISPVQTSVALTEDTISALVERVRSATSKDSPSSPSLPSFFDVGKAVHTDKVVGHRYECMYETALASMRLKPIKLLEIGLGFGAFLAAQAELTLLV